MSEHTPLPWHASRQSFYVSDTNHNCLAQMLRGRNENKANAAFIVKAVNAHDALVDLVQTLIDNDPDEPIADNGMTVLHGWRERAQRILASVRQSPLSPDLKASQRPTVSSETNLTRPPSQPGREEIDKAAEYLVQTVERKLWSGIRADGRARDSGFEPFHYSQYSYGVNGNARQEDYCDVIRQIAAILALTKGADPGAVTDGPNDGLTNNPELSALIERAKNHIMTPEEAYEQRRSFTRGMCPSNRDYKEWCETVDRLMPPLALSRNSTDE